MMTDQRGTAPLKINIGCGFDKRPDFLNIDSDPNCKPDVLIVDNDLSGLPQGHFEEALALDVLEHIPRAFTVAALFDWAMLLKPGGRLFVETSYIYGIIDMMRRQDDFETAFNYSVLLFGNQEHAGDYHHNGFTQKTLRTYLRAAGFTPDELSIREDWLIRGWATRTEDWSGLLVLQSYPEFVEKMFNDLVGRPPESWRLKAVGSEPDSPERLAEIKALAASKERLYYLGKSETVPF